MTYNKKTNLVYTIMVATIVVSIGLTPVFASHQDQTYHAAYGVDTGETYTSSQSTIHCIGASVDRCGAQLVVDNDGYEWIKTFYKIGGGAVVCDLNVVIEINGNTVSDLNFSEIETFGQWEYFSYHPSSIESTDVIQQYLTFDNCFVDA